MRKLRIAILGLHLFILAAMLFAPAPNALKPKREHLVVKTVALKPPVRIEKAMEKKLPQKREIPEKKKVVAAPASKPVKKEVAKPLPKKSAPKSVVPQHLLRELEETIAKIDENRDKMYDKLDKSRAAGKLQPPEQIAPLKIDAVEEPDRKREAAGYRELLIGALHQTLQLPDYGEVKVQLTLRKDGSVESMKVLHAESEKNKKYIEMHLPFLKFPSFEGIRSEELVFIFTFCNEI